MIDENKIINQVSDRLVKELSGVSNQAEDRKTLSPAFYQFLHDECESLTKLHCDKAIREYSFWKFIKFKIRGYYK